MSSPSTGGLGPIRRGDRNLLSGIRSSLPSGRGRHLTGLMMLSILMTIADVASCSGRDVTSKRQRAEPAKARGSQ